MKNDEKTFEALNAELATVRVDLEATTAELTATRASGKSDKPTVDQYTRLQSKIDLLTARKDEIENALPTAELAALQEAVEVQIEKAGEAGAELKSEETRIGEQLRELFDYPGVPVPFFQIVRHAKPVRDRINAHIRALNAMNAASERAARFENDNGLAPNRHNTPPVRVAR